EYGHKRQNQYTVADYFALPDDQRAELIDGVFYDMATPLFVHQDILGYVFAEIYHYIRAHRGSCKVIASPSAVQLCCDDKTMVEPDLYIVCDQTKVRRFGIYGAPDFVLEILSQSTRKKDMTIKLYKYCEAGVKEYWLIDPVKQVLITYDFTDPEYLPKVTALQGEAGISLYKGELKISLSEIAQIIREAEERE
ncbi:MAG: Uma2 family endonuclease, partial [Lachnospiraceae bacterium]|nr:Uma2 family endonuclease [Lachnospiraceae bacterium]